MLATTSLRRSQLRPDCASVVILGSHAERVGNRLPTLFQNVEDEMQVWRIMPLGAGCGSRTEWWDEWDSLPPEERASLEKAQEDYDNEYAEFKRSSNQRW